MLYRTDEFKRIRQRMQDFTVESVEEQTIRPFFSKRLSVSYPAKRSGACRVEAEGIR